MAEVVWARPAFDDLREVHRFIARDSKRFADITIRRIRSAARRLARFPMSGRPVPELPDLPHREILVGDYRVLYRYSAERSQVLVLAVVHGRRVLPLDVVDRG